MQPVMCQLFFMRQDELKGLAKGAQTTEAVSGLFLCRRHLVVEQLWRGQTKRRLLQLQFGYMGAFYFYFLVVFPFLKNASNFNFSSLSSSPASGWGGPGFSSKCDGLFDVCPTSSVGCLSPLENYLSRCLARSHADAAGVFP